MHERHQYAPGWPGSPPRWTSSSKEGVGTSLNPASRVWFTVSHGIFNEIYYPRVDQACVRDMGMIVTDGGDYFSEGSVTRTIGSSGPLRARRRTASRTGARTDGI